MKVMFPRGRPQGELADDGADLDQSLGQHGVSSRIHSIDTTGQNRNTGASYLQCGLMRNTVNPQRQPADDDLAGRDGSSGELRSRFAPAKRRFPGSHD